VGSTLYLFVEKGDGLLVEGEGAHQQGIEDDSTTPDIHGSTFIFAFSDNLGGGIVGAAAGRLEKPAILHEVAESEIDDLDDFAGPDEDVFGFEVAVGDEVMVGVGNSSDDLPEEEASISFADLVILYVVIEFSSLC
jgi:hypothetical protein